jgi:hypothetical protein
MEMLVLNQVLEALCLFIFVRHPEHEAVFAGVLPYGFETGANLILAFGASEMGAVDIPTNDVIQRGLSDEIWSHRLGRDLQRFWNLFVRIGKVDVAGFLWGDR